MSASRNRSTQIPRQGFACWRNARRYRSRITPIWSSLVLLLIAASVVRAETFNDEGYRGIPYKAPTPDSVPGGSILLFAEDVAGLIASRSVTLLNVSPISLSPPDPAGTRIWIPKRGSPMLSIPGSVWLPNIGYQTLDDDMRRYLESQLEAITGNNRDQPLLIYCTSDCWMSWNAVRRLSREYGFREIYWYPMGIDGWREAGHELVRIEPAEFKPGQGD